MWPVLIEKKIVKTNSVKALGPTIQLDEQFDFQPGLHVEFATALE